MCASPCWCTHLAAATSQQPSGGGGRRDRRARAPASTEHREFAPPHREALQSKLSQFLASSSDTDEDPLEELPVEHNQAVAAIGKAIYEVVRLDPAGRARNIYVKRRDLLRGMRLQPRDLRRIDPSLASLTKPSTSITVKENALLVQLGGVRCPRPPGRPFACPRPRPAC